MKFDRRRVLRLFTGAALFASSAAILKSVFLPATLSSGERAILKAYLDTLIPDDDSPGAIALGIPEKMAAAAEKDRDYLRLLHIGCSWLDATSGSNGFVSSVEAVREELLDQLEHSEIPSEEWVFYQRTRRDAFQHYYADPRTIAALDYPGPPQPVGFPDYGAPPGEDGNT